MHELTLIRQHFSHFVNSFKKLNHYRITTCVRDRDGEETRMHSIFHSLSLRTTATVCHLDVCNCPTPLPMSLSHTVWFFCPLKLLEGLAGPIVSTILKPVTLDLIFMLKTIRNLAPFKTNRHTSFEQGAFTQCWLNSSGWGGGEKKTHQGQYLLNGSP